METRDQGILADPAVLAVPAEQALALLERAGGDSVHLIEAWVKHGNVAAVAEAAERASGPTRKAARRGLNVLKARGLRVPERRRVATVPAAHAEEEIVQAWLLPPDPEGTSLLVLAAHRPTTRCRVVVSFLQQARSLLRIERLELSSSELKQLLQRLGSGLGFKPVKVPVDWARARVAQARRQNHELGRPEPLGLEAASDLLEPAPALDPPHPLDEEGLELTLEDARELARRSEQLHRLPEFSGWLPAHEAVEEMLLGVGQELAGRQKPAPDQVSQLIDKHIALATDRYFTPERRTTLVLNMKDSALSVLEREGEQAALEVVATIKCIEHAGLITDPPHQIPFLVAFFGKAVFLRADKGTLTIPVPGWVPDLSSDRDSSEQPPVESTLDHDSDQGLLLDQAEPAGPEPTSREGTPETQLPALVQPAPGDADDSGPNQEAAVRPNSCPEPQGEQSHRSGEEPFPCPDTSCDKHPVVAEAAPSVPELQPARAETDTDPTGAIDQAWSDLEPEAK